MNDAEGIIAKLTLTPKTKQVENIILYQSNIRFECKRCATFCCKLGGPTLSSKDIERFKKAGYCETEFLDTSHGCPQNTISGSCFYLRFDMKGKVHKCSVYDCRPTLCRLYPFYFEKTGPNSLVLKIMPCRGINRLHGELVNENFIIANLFSELKTYTSNQNLISAV